MSHDVTFVPNLTFMSIWDQITALEASGRLHRLVPSGRRRSKRCAFYTEQARGDMAKGSAIDLFGSRGDVRAALMRWVSGGRVYATDSGKPKFLRRLCGPPPEIWEIRVTEPNVQVRLFGRFAEPDTFIITQMRTRDSLGNKKSRSWKLAMRDCEQEWYTLFPKHHPYKGVTIHDYVTENCDDFSI